MLHQSLEFGNLAKSIDTVKDELTNLSEVHDIKIEDSERGLENCKVSNKDTHNFTPWFSLSLNQTVFISPLASHGVYRLLDCYSDI